MEDAAKAGRLGGLCSGCTLSAGVCCRTRLRLADRCSASRNIGVVGRNFQMGRGERWFNALGIFRWQRTVVFNDLASHCLQKTSASQRTIIPSVIVKKCFSTLEQVFVFKGLPPLNALGPWAAFERPGRRPPVAAIHFRRQAQRTSCKSRVRTVCPEQPGGGVTREKENVRVKRHKKAGTSRKAPANGHE